MKLKKITDLLNRSEELSLISIIVIMVIMAIMGTVFSSIMGTYKASTPMTINSNKAFYLTETPATFALQEAKYKFYGRSFNYGSSTDDPYVVSSVTTGNVTEVADYGFEMPGFSDDVTTGVNDDEVDDDDSSDLTFFLL